MSHKVELRDRTVQDRICIEPSCEYSGQPAVQGHCYSQLNPVEEAYLQRIEEKAQKFLTEIKETAGPKKYLEHLETHFICIAINYEFILDELVRLRRENAKLHLQAGISPAS